jgi:hypothetical protein
MLLALDIGNSAVKGGLFDETDLVRVFSSSTGCVDTDGSVGRDWEEAWGSHLEDVYRSLQREGCLSYRERTPPVEREVGFLRGLEREIIVDVGRDGELLLVSGKHRLSLSRILGLETVPVCFLVRHAEWMETRREVARSGDEVPDHPDLRDLSNGGE